MIAPVDVLAVQHQPVVAKRDPKSIDFHTKSYSFDFRCPQCGKVRRFNTNYLGGRRLPLCDGIAIKPTERLPWEQYHEMSGGVSA